MGVTKTRRLRGPSVPRGTVEPLPVRGAEPQWGGYRCPRPRPRRQVSREGRTAVVLLRQEIGDVLRDARRRQGRTLREVSSVARVSLGYLSEVERGQKEASTELLASICGALDVPLSSVLHEVSRRVGRPSRGARGPRRGRPAGARYRWPDGLAAEVNLRDGSSSARPDTLEPASPARRPGRRAGLGLRARCAAVSHPTARWRAPAAAAAAGPARLLLEPRGLDVELRPGSAPSCSRACSPSGRQPLESKTLPGAQHRRDHVVVVDAQVVDAGHRDLHRLAAEALDDRAGHLEVPTTSQIACIVCVGSSSSAACSRLR